MNKLITILLISQLFYGCSLMNSHKETKIKDKNVILFIPGYKGSSLRETSSKRRIWVTAREELFGKKNMALNSEQLGVKNSYKLEADGLLEKVQVIPKIWEINLYNSWIKNLKKFTTPDTELISFDYDWRQENSITARELHNFILRIKDKGAKKIFIVAHSMGGLMLSYYLRYGDLPLDSATPSTKETWSGVEHIDGIAIMGAPFLGSSWTFRNMQTGTINKYNKDLLANYAISTFPSAFQMLPPIGSEMLKDSEKKPLQEMIFNANNWKEFHWGLFTDSQKLSEETREARLNYTQKLLDDSNLFSTLIHKPLKNKPKKQIPFLLLSSRGIKTLTYIYLDKNTKNLGHDKESMMQNFSSIPQEEASYCQENLLLLSPLESDGDGVVTIESSTPPKAYQEAFEVQYISSNYLHDQLGNDENAVKQIADKINVIFNPNVKNIQH
jgi:pimeloyl-ACP methyl ester carboxylesterase